MPAAKIVDRIRKLQGLAQSPNPHEAEAAAEQALRLMREHAVSQRDVDEAVQAASDPLVKRSLYLEGFRLVDYAEKTKHVHWVAGWKRSLANAVGEYLGLQSSYKGGTAVFSYYGHTSDIAAAVELYGVCARQIDRGCQAWLKEEKRKDPFWTLQDGRDGGFRYKESAVDGLESKFEELLRESAVDHAEGHALVLSRKQKVSSWVNATYTFKKGNLGDFGGRVGFESAGYETGRKLKLTSDVGIEGRTRKGLPGGGL
jgi:hypothetical protein